MERYSGEERRRFTAAEKAAVELVTGQSGSCDHIYPYSKGGKTTVENCQLIPMALNRAKSDFSFEPRKWQKRFFEAWETRKPNTPFMLIAIPASGKTMAALEIARRWMAAGCDRRVIVVVPSDNLRNQWQHEAQRFGMDLQTKEFGTNFKHDYHGAVVTYQLVSNQPLVFNKLCSVAPTMVIFDEIHHCAEDSHFGNGIRTAFELAKEKLCMSGTPWKTDGEKIPFLDYDVDGHAKADYRYDLPEALQDNVVRYLVFDYAKGKITNEVTGEVYEVTKHLTDEQAAARLRYILDPEGQFVRGVIEDAHKKLLDCRTTIPDAAAMAICIDQNHAQRVARVISEITLCNPSIIVSDEDLENDSVEDFRNSSKQWLVTVRKVSEGTDIKRLQVLCYLTNVVSDLFFRQAIGRVSRLRYAEDLEAYVYLPADYRLYKCAKNIENVQVVALSEESQYEPREVDISQIQKVFGNWTTEHNGTDTVLIGTVEVPVAEAKQIELVANKVGITMKQAMQTRLLWLNGSPSIEPSSQLPQTIGLEERQMQARRNCQKRAQYLAKLLGVTPKEIHSRWKPQVKMNLDELDAKNNALQNEIVRVKASTKEPPLCSTT